MARRRIQAGLVIAVIAGAMVVIDGIVRVQEPGVLSEGIRELTFIDGDIPNEAFGEPWQMKSEANDEPSMFGQQVDVAVEDGSINGAGLNGYLDGLVSRAVGESCGPAVDSKLPDHLANEICLLPGARNMRVDDDLGLMSYAVDLEVDEAYGKFRQVMGQLGWVEVELGGVTGATFLKETGAVIWALASFTQVEDASVVLVIYQKAG